MSALLAVALLAALDPASDPTSVGVFVLIAIALAVAGTTIWSNTRPNPSLHRQFVTREEWDRHSAELSLRLTRIEVGGEERVQRIHERIDHQTEQIIAVIREAQK